MSTSAELAEAKRHKLPHSSTAPHASALYLAPAVSRPLLVQRCSRHSIGNPPELSQSLGMPRLPMNSCTIPVALRSTSPAPAPPHHTPFPPPRVPQPWALSLLCMNCPLRMAPFHTVCVPLPWPPPLPAPHSSDCHGSRDHNIYRHAVGSRSC